jgi:hypothetical protein
MDALIEKAWRLYNDAVKLDFVVQPSIPILFFGDSKRYFKSQRKVVTVGLNPSKIEFPGDGHWSRFPDAEGIDDALTNQSSENYQRALNNYFSIRPYRQWFNSLEPLLNGMGCSFYGKLPNVAMHTDICSPFATNPTWSGLSRSNRIQLEQVGLELWHSLLEFLQPDIVLISVPRRYRCQVELCWQTTEWETFFTVTDKVNGYKRKTPCVIQSRQARINNKPVSFFSGRTVNTPFGSISNETKQLIGKAIERQVYVGR